MYKNIQRILTDIAIVGYNLWSASLPLAIHRISATLRVSGNNRFLIIPCDAAEPIGSMGDWAMLASLMQEITTKYPDAEFTIVGTHAHQVAIPHVGRVNVEPAWHGRQGSIMFGKLLDRHDYIYAIGADVMDGKYGSSLVCRITSYCNHAARLNKPATIIGFSFNKSPRWPAVYSLSRINPAVNVYVRDSHSLERYIRTVGQKVTLSADIAFLMKPDITAGSVVEDWIQAMKETGNLLVGININAHAFEHIINRNGRSNLIEEIVNELSNLSTQRRIAYVLIPHDIKQRSGDKYLLQGLQKGLLSAGNKNVFYYAPENPTRVKRLTSLLDLVLTGRMHLAIAALGTTTPVICIAYQGKFEGLYSHFNLPLEELLHPDAFDVSELSVRINDGLEKREVRKEQIAKYLPSVTRLAGKNISIEN